MRGSRSRIEVMRRVTRVRMIEHRLALYQLAEARLEQTRMRELAERSAALAVPPATTRASHDGAGLTNSLIFGAQTLELTVSANSLQQDADRTADKASSEMAATGRRRDHVIQWATTQQAHLKAKDLSREAAQAGQLARRLLNHGNKTTPKSRKDPK